LIPAKIIDDGEAYKRRKAAEALRKMAHLLESGAEYGGTLDVLETFDCDEVPIESRGQSVLALSGSGYLQISGELRVRVTADD